MFGRVIIGSTVAAIVLMIWGILFWAVLAIPEDTMDPLPNGEATAEMIAAALPGSGVYVWPPTSDDGLPATAPIDRARQPQMQIFYREAALDPMSPTTMARGFLHMFAVSLLAAVLLAVAAPRIESYLRRVGFVLLAGVLAGVAVNLAQPIWFGHPWDYHLLMFVNEAMKGLLLGLVLAGVVRQKPQAGVQL
jgi:hypothetical protein